MAIEQTEPLVEKSSNLHLGTALSDEYRDRDPRTALKILRAQAESEPITGAVAAREPTQLCPQAPIYDKIITTASRRIFDLSALGDVQTLLNKYDCSIKTPQEAIARAEEVLKGTGDLYNHVLSAEEIDAIKEQESGTFSGIGVKISIETFDAQGKIIEPDDRLDAPATPGATAVGYEQAPATSDHHTGTVITYVLPGSPAYRAGLEEGDRITQINEMSLTDRSFDKVSELIRGPRNTSIELTLMHGGETVHQLVTRDTIQAPSVSEPVDKGDGITYIRVSNFARFDTSDELQAALLKLPNTRAFVIDVRDNPGGLIIEALAACELFVSEGPLMTVHSREISEPSSPTYDQALYKLNGNFLYTYHSNPNNPDDDYERVEDRLPRVTGPRPVIVLQNAWSASAAEIFVGALHDTGKITTLGDKTLGKGIGQTTVPDMPEGTNLRLTTLRYQTPSGLWLATLAKTESASSHPCRCRIPGTQNLAALRICS